jgi:predicted nucleic acid-binding protein
VSGRHKGFAIADTNVISYALKRESLAIQYAQLLTGYDIRISFVTCAELHRWAERDNWGSRRRALLKVFLSDYKVVPYSKGMEEVFARITTERQRAGRRLENSDAWIATTAIYHDVPLATHDADFVDTAGLRIITADPKGRMVPEYLVASRTPQALNMRCRCSY